MTGTHTLTHTHADSMLNMQGCKWRVLSASHSVTIFVLAAVLARVAAMKVARENKSYEQTGCAMWVCTPLSVSVCVCFGEFKGIQCHPWRLIMRAISGVSCGNEFCGCNEARAGAGAIAVARTGAAAWCWLPPAAHERSCHNFPWTLAVTVVANVASSRTNIALIAPSSSWM